MNPDTATAGPIVRDSNYKSPTYGSFIPNPAYQGAGIQKFDTKTGGTIGTQGSVGFGTFVPPPATTTIPANNIGGVKPLQFPPTPEDATNPVGTGLSIPTTTADGKSYSYNGTSWDESDGGKTDTTTTGSESTGLDTPLPAKGLFDNERKSYFDAIKELFNKPKDERAARDATGVTALNSQINELNNQIQSLQKQSAAQMIAQEDRLAPSFVITGAQQKIDRDRTIKMLGLSAISQTLQGNLSIAQQNADDMVDMKYGPIETYLKYQKEALDMLEKDLTKEEAKRLEEVKRENELEDARTADAKADAKTINELALNAVANNPNDKEVARLAQEAMEKGDIRAATEALAKYQIDPVAAEGKLLDNDAKRLGIKKLNAEIAKLNNEGGTGLGAVTNPAALKYAGALQVILGSTSFTAEQKKNLINSVNNGEDPSVVIRNQAKNIMGQVNASKLDNFETAKAQMDSIETTLASYYAAGGKTNLLRGSYESVINNLGEVKDPKLVGVATQVASALQIYRNAVSGTAYSVQEGKDIASIFPGINKSEGLNKAILEGRRKAFDDTIDSMYSNTLGAKTYEVVKNGAKGKLTDREFVEKQLNLSGLKYEDYITKIPEGQMGVIDNQTGEIGYIPKTEFIKSKYTPI